MDKQLRIVGYCRVSTKKQAKNGLSLDAQAERLEAWTKAMGHRLVDFYRDPGVSGSTLPTRRPGFRGALYLCESGEADGIAAVKLDRFSRSLRQFLQIIERFKDKDWALVSLSESLDTSTAAGKLIVSILASFAEFERNQTGERIKAVLAHLKANGRKYSKVIPWGYTVDDQKYLHHNEAEQAMLRRMFELKLEGHGPTAIARAIGMNPRSGTPFRPASVHAIIQHRLERELRRDTLTPLAAVIPKTFVPGRPQ
jgi:site-specific DNA recombinase